MRSRCDQEKVAWQLQMRPVRLVGSDAEPEYKRSLTSGNGSRIPSCKALSTVVGNRAIDNGSAIDALPCVEDEEKIRKPFQHHHSLTLRTFH